MGLLEQTYKWERFGFDFWVFYRDKNMFFIYKNEEFIGSPVGYIKDYNEFLKTTKILSTLDKQRVLERYSKNQPIIKKLLPLTQYITQ